MVPPDAMHGKLCSIPASDAPLALEHGDKDNVAPVHGWGFAGVSETVFVRAGSKEGAAKKKTAAALSEANLSLFTKQWQAEQTPGALGSNKVSGLRNDKDSDADGDEGEEGESAPAAQRVESGASVQKSEKDRAGAAVRKGEVSRLRLTSCAGGLIF